MFVWIEDLGVYNMIGFIKIWIIFILLVYKFLGFFVVRNGLEEWVE